MLRAIALARRRELGARLLETARDVIAIFRGRILLFETGDLALQPRDVRMAGAVQRLRAGQLRTQRLEAVRRSQDAFTAVGEHHRVRLELGELRFEEHALLV